jgi:serine/threonine protein kinase
MGVLLWPGELRVKISDFGLAVRLQTPDEEHFTLCGTPNYIAPEVSGRHRVLTAECAARSECPTYM